MTQQPPMRVAVLISGSGTNLQAIIDAISAGELAIDIIGVVSDNPAAAGLERARRAGIPTHCVDFRAFDSRAGFDAALDATLAQLAPGLVVLAGYMRILSVATVQRYAGRMLNIHPSLLPAYPGLHTHARVLAAGDHWHGCTVHFVIPELDAGPAVIRYRVAVHPGETEPRLQARVQQGEYRIYPRAIRWFAERRLQCIDNVVWLDGARLAEPVTVEEDSCDTP